MAKLAHFGEAHVRSEQAIRRLSGVRSGSKCEELCVSNLARYTHYSDLDEACGNVAEGPTNGVMLCHDGLTSVRSDGLDAARLRR